MRRRALAKQMVVQFVLVRPSRLERFHQAVPAHSIPPDLCAARHDLVSRTLLAHRLWEFQRPRRLPPQGFDQGFVDPSLESEDSLRMVDGPETLLLGDPSQDSGQSAELADL